MSREFLMKVNDYGEERTITNGEAFVFCVSNILYNKPGFIPELPTVGLNLTERRYMVTSDVKAIEELKNDIYDMVKLFYPDHGIIVTAETRYDKDNRSYLFIDIENISLGVAGTFNYKNNTTNVTIRYKDYSK